MKKGEITQNIGATLIMRQRKNTHNKHKADITQETKKVTQETRTDISLQETEKDT